MNAIDATGWLIGVEREPSPNQGERPDGEDISLLIIHNISLPPGEFGDRYIHQLFTNRLDATAHPYFAGLAATRVSAHLLIDRGGALTQFVGFDARAWHAGESCFGGRANCNDFAIGIELEGTDTTAYTDAQYQALARVARLLMARYPQLTAARIVGHSDVAPTRKTDPGPAFDWHTFNALLAINSPLVTRE
ncbi:MAG: 1,6-anhydro-N-acetylmuramyl-L-alanine amidase AmpD [Porticoccaceae bacterium]